jgi:hypothetical protein
MGKSFMEYAVPIALGATGLGLAGVGPMAGLLAGEAAAGAGAAGAAGAAAGATGAAEAAGAAGAAEGLLTASEAAGGAGMVFNPATGTYLNPAYFVGEGTGMPLFTGGGSFMEQLGTGAQSLASNMGGNMNGLRTAQAGMQMMQGQQQPQGPQNIFGNTQTMPRQMGQAGSFQDSSNISPQQIDELKRRQWMGGLGRA